jgi:hypothetical protein
VTELGEEEVEGKETPWVEATEFTIPANIAKQEKHVRDNSFLKI